MKQFKKLKPCDIEIFMSSKLLDIYVCINEDTLDSFSIYEESNKLTPIKKHIIENTASLPPEDKMLMYHKIFRNKKYYKLLTSEDSVIAEIAIDMILDDNKELVDKYLKQFV